MKKAFVVFVLLFVFAFSTVSVYAESGLNSIWYQLKGVKEDDEESANFTKYLGTKSDDPKGNWDSNRDTLFKELQEMGKLKVKTFEIPQKEESEEFYDNAEAANVVIVGGEWEPNYVVVKYTGVIVAKETAEYQFISSYVDNGFVCYIDDKKVFEYWGPDMWMDDGKPGTQEGDKFNMEADKAYKFEAYYFEGHGGEYLAMDVKVGGSQKAFDASGLMLFTETPKPEELAAAKATPTPTPTPTATPTPSVTTAQASTATATATAKATSTSGSTDTDTDFPVVPVVIGGVALVAVAGGAVFFIKKKK